MGSLVPLRALGFGAVCAFEDLKQLTARVSGSEA